jgi:putative hydrolase of the HAD superfamily
MTSKINTMIKAVIFDYGNIISSVDNDHFLEEFARTGGRTGPELQEFINEKADLLKQYETGLVTSDEFFERFVKSGGFDIGKDEFIKLFTGRFSPMTATRDLIRRLKVGYKLGLLSNTNAWDFEYEITQCDVFNLFDTVTVSFKAGALKPDEKIYLDALGKLGFQPHECVYIDDIKEYADAASALGIKGIHYASHERMIEELRELNCYHD